MDERRRATTTALYELLSEELLLLHPRPWHASFDLSMVLSEKDLFDFYAPTRLMKGGFSQKSDSTRELIFPFLIIIFFYYKRAFGVVDKLRYRISALKRIFGLFSGKNVCRRAKFQLRIEKMLWVNEKKDRKKSVLPQILLSQLDLISFGQELFEVGQKMQMVTSFSFLLIFGTIASRPYLDLCILFYISIQSLFIK